MSDEAPSPKKKKGGKMKTLLLVLIGGIVLIGGGIGAGIYAAGAGLVGGHPGEVEDPNKPKLVLKDGVEEPGNHKPSKDGTDHADPALYKASYFVLEQPFTSNLRDSDGFVQLGLGVSTFYDQRVLDNLKNNEMPVRSAVLLTLADQDAFVISTPEGKEKLQEALREAINDTLKKREGFGGIDSVYFTSFIIQ